MEQFIITRDWIFDNRTKRGAWTKEQINALGIKWPATSGWINEIVDTAISSHNSRLFEEGANKKSNSEKPAKMTIDKCIEYLFKNVNRIDARQIVRLRNVESKYLDLNKRKA